MSVAASQQQTFLRLLAALRPRWRTDRALPAFIQQRLARERAFGARDRRLYRELLYTTLRHRPWIEPWLDREPARAVKIAAWLAADTKDTRAFRAHACGDWPAPGSLAERAAFLEADPHALLPAWFREHCPEAFAPAELEALLGRAPLWLRLQTDAPHTVADEFAARGWRVAASPILASAWRVLDDVDVTPSEAFRTGRIEVQDLGSQLLLETIGLAPGGRWLDACAGAGGKTLQLARLLGPAATIDAHDVRPAALAELQTRAARAGVKNIRVVRAPDAAHGAAGYDGVLVDAPCSGSGTWRRAPHLKWTTTAALVAEHAALQVRLLGEFARAVRHGGRLVYATCSLSREENEAVVARFLAAQPVFEPAEFRQTFGVTPRGHGLTLLPSRHDTDGFFVAVFRRK
jgi:16S rRNA (cytosine967-C5)-methyltransferase